jgi:hypothetical protein
MRLSDHEAHFLLIAWRIRANPCRGGGFWHDGLNEKESVFLSSERFCAQPIIWAARHTFVNHLSIKIRLDLTSLINQSTAR